MVASIILGGFALLVIGGLGGFLLARLARPRRPVPAAPVGRPSRIHAAVVEEASEEEGSGPTLSPPSLAPSHGLDSFAALVLPDYDPDAENEDDVPTTLYRHQDEDLEAILAEFDTGQHHR